MSSNWMILAELTLVFGVVFAWGYHELKDLKRYKDKENSGSDRAYRATPVQKNTVKQLAYRPAGDAVGDKPPDQTGHV